MTIPAASAVHRASLILTASYVAPTAYSLPQGAASVSLVYTYTLGGAGSYAHVRPIWTIAGQTARDMSTGTAVITADEIVIPVYQLAIRLPNATCTNTVVFDVPEGATAVSFSAREVGDTGSPGTLATWIAV